MRFISCALFLAIVHSIAGVCVNDSDCSLNGKCENAKCVCFPYFRGDKCSILNLSGGGKVWPAEGAVNVSSWGMTTVYDDISKKYHTVVDVACDKSGVLVSGGGNSFMVHLTQSSVDAPRMLKEAVSVPVSFNPQMWTHGGVFYMIVRVNAILDKPTEICPGNDSNSYPSLLDAAQIKPPKVQPMPPGEGQPLMWVATTTDMENPKWEVLPVSIEKPPAPHVSNPSVWFSDALQKHVMAFRYNSNQGEKIGIAFSDAGSHANYTAVTSLSCTGCEDPYLWADSEGHFHILYHQQQHGRHAYSATGMNWTITEEDAFSVNVSYSATNVERMARRERPSMIHENGIPKYFYSAVKDAAGNAYTLRQDLF